MKSKPVSHREDLKFSVPRLRNFALVLAVVWTVVFAGIYLWDLHRINQTTLELAANEARAHFNKDLAFRLWATDHGRIYVPLTEKQRPDPHLEHIPERDITTRSGQELTLINPARIVRQLNEEYGALYGVAGRITSLKPLRPENRPDDWEAKAIRRFESGAEEVKEYTSIDGEPYLRLMKPLMVSAGCLMCHATQGFKVGDVSGGVGVAVPMKEMVESGNRYKRTHGVVLGVIWLLGMLVLLGVYRRNVQAASERTQAIKALRKSEARKHAIMESALDCVVTIDHMGRILEFNPSAERTFGYKRQDVVGEDMARLLIPPALRKLHAKGFNRNIATGTQTLLGTRVETMAMRADGSEFPVELTVTRIDLEGVPLYTAYLRDLTETRKMEEKLTFQSTHDALTGLANRKEFERRLRHLMEDVAFISGEHALLYIDLDQFKVVNDNVGPTAADRFLVQIGGLLQERMRAGDTLARMGGDEFGVLLSHCPLDKAMQVGKDLMREIQEYRFEWEGHNYSVGVSAGLVPVSGHSQSMEDVLSIADAACYMAKDEGRNRLKLLRPDDVELARRRGEMRWVNRIHDAFEQGRFMLYQQRLQPLQGGEGEDLCHYEILIRMQDEEGAFVPPVTFLSAAERYGLMPTIDRWVVRSAFTWLSEHPAHLEQLKVCSINLSGLSITDDGFRQFIIDQLEYYRIPPGRICFEVTETAVVSNLAKAVRFIDRLRAEGCLFALDDFGTGMSSFGYLKNLPVDFLKIDGTFVRDILDDEIDLAMVRSINEIGHVMGKKTIAEFVENFGIEEVIREIGVDYAQGYGISKPRPLTELPGGVAACSNKQAG